MTERHRHRIWRVKHGGWVHCVLCLPVLWWSRDEQRVERSRFVYGPSRVSGVWTLHPLGVLHALFGLTLETRVVEDAGGETDD